MRLADALGMVGGDVVALVGGGGKTTAMFVLAREVVARGGQAITTTTTRIVGAQIALSPAHVAAADATADRVTAAHRGDDVVHHRLVGEHGAAVAGRARAVRAGA